MNENLSMSLFSLFQLTGIVWWEPQKVFANTKNNKLILAFERFYIIVQRIICFSFWLNQVYGNSQKLCS